MKRFARLAAVAVIAVAFSAQAQNQSSGELQRLRGEISRMKRSLAALQSQAQTVEQELQAIDLQIALKTREVELATATRDRAAAEQKSSMARVAQLRQNTSSEKRVLAARLRQLQRFGGLSYFRALLSLESKTNPFEAIAMLTYLANRDARDIAEFQRTQQELLRRQKELSSQQQRFAAAALQVTREQRQLEHARARRHEILSRLERESQRSEARIAELEEKARRLEQLLRLLYDRGAPEPGKQRITEYKGALQWPVNGPVIEDFGRQRSEKFATYTVNNGIKIAVPENTPARAVFPGTVLFSQWFKGYGNLVIIDHGDRVFTLYGNTRIGMVKVGEKVQAGQAIATVNHDEEGTGGFLYFEIRENNKPVNPRNWLR